MNKERYRVRQLEYCNKQMFGNLIVTCPTYSDRLTKKLIQPVPITVKPVATPGEIVRKHMMEAEKRKASLLVDQLLLDIHNSFQHSTDYNSTTSGRSSQKFSRAMSYDLCKRDIEDLSALVVLLGGQIERVGVKLVRRLKRREVLRRQQEAHCDVISCQLKKLLPNTPEDMCFTVNPQSGESGFSQWVSAMKMVAQLPGGIPPEFRKRLWLTMAEKHLASKGVDWNRVERTCFSEWAHPDDGELGVQIVKDLHRTGCSLFCGEGGQENQALLKKVLLAYARWNKAVGYCQGFNMLAALILQVTDKSETDALKLMIYLIEGVLPDSYFADSLRGLSVDMAVFRELLRTKLPKLSKHLDLLQNLAKEGTTSYEPPLTNVFTMQWFLTLFCNCLPQPSVLRVWDLILLEGNEILLRTALAIWQALAEKILRVRTADEFYCIMGILTTELLENNLIDANTLIKTVVSIGPLTELRSLRDHYLYNINPLGPIPTNLGIAEKQLKIYPKERIALDISTLKKQYVKLRQRQRQAHIIFSAAINRQPPTKAPVAMNHLLLGKSALVPAKRLGPPKGSIPPARVPTTLHWKDTSKQPSSSSSSDTELCDDDNPPSDSSDEHVRKSPVPDLPEDNLNPSDTSNFEEDVETSSTSVVEIDNTENQKSGDIFESLVSSEFDVEKIADVDSEDDSVDFELFLEDRVKCLKQDEVISDDKRVSLSRRNSERALQIIQENSMILHRILQCQSRLSLSPPGTETGDTDEESAFKKFQDCPQSRGEIGTSSSHSTLEPSEYTKEEIDADSHKPEEYQDISDYDLPKTPEHNAEYVFPSKYEAILAKSRDLNEKCDDLFFGSEVKTEGKEGYQLPESKTFTNQDELIDLISDCTELKNINECFDAAKSEIKSNIYGDFNPHCEDNIKPWLDQMDVSRNLEHPQDSAYMEDELTPQQDVSYDFKHSTGDSASYLEETTKTEQSKSVIPDMVVSFSENGNNSEKESGNLFSGLEDEWIKKYLNRDKITVDSTSNYVSRLDTLKSKVSGDTIGERKSLSATNSVEMADKRDERRSLSATNSMERTSSPSYRDSEDDSSKEDTFARFKMDRKSPDAPYEASILSSPRSRLSSCNSRDFISPINESSISIPSRLTSPSPETDYDSCRKYSPRRTYTTHKEDGVTSLLGDSQDIKRNKSPQSTLELIEDPKSGSRFHEDSENRIEKDQYYDSPRHSRSIQEILKDLSSTSDDHKSRDFVSSTGMASSTKSLISLGKCSDDSKNLEHLSFRRNSPSDSSLSTEEQLRENCRLSEENREGIRSTSEGENYEYRFLTSPKLSSPGSYSSRSSPLLRDEERRSTSPRSPTKVFNPFPVPLSLRQNKEIGVKLGLYKK